MSRVDADRMMRGSRGLSMVELLMSIAISVVVLALALGTFSTLAGVLRQQRGVADIQLEQHFALLELEKDLRNAGADPRGAGLFAGEASPVDIVPAGQPLAGGLRLRTDRTGAEGTSDGDLEDDGEVVVYLLDTSSGVLNRWIATGDGGMSSAPMLSRCRQFDAALLDRTGAPAAGDSVSQVRITLASSTEPGAPSSTELTRVQRISVVLPNQVLVGQN